MSDDLIARLLTHLALSQPLTVFDVETTGVLPGIDWVVQIAILRVEPDGTCRRFTSLVNPKKVIPAEATAIHGITNDMVATAPSFQVLLAQIEPLFVGAALCGYNGEFDRKMVGAELQRAGRPNLLATAPLIDPFRIYQQREPRDLSAAVRLYVGRELTDAHDAMADVEATLEVLVGQAERYEDLPRTVGALAAYCKRSDPSWLDPDGKIIWRDGEARMAFGPKAGASLRELAATDRGLLKWVLGKDFSPEVKTLVQNAMVGKFPTAPAPRAGEAVTVL